MFGVAVLAVDLVLLAGEKEQHDDEHDQGTLSGHVEAERKAENRNDDLVERNDEHVDDVPEEEPDAEMGEHQSGGLIPVRFFVGFAVGLGGHGTSSPSKEPSLRIASNGTGVAPSGAPYRRDENWALGLFPIPWLFLQVFQDAVA
jgi:hypothetical protein